MLVQQDKSNNNNNNNNKGPLKVILCEHTHTIALIRRWKRAGLLWISKKGAAVFPVTHWLSVRALCCCCRDPEFLCLILKSLSLVSSVSLHFLSLRSSALFLMVSSCVISPALIVSTCASFPCVISLSRPLVLRRFVSKCLPSKDRGFLNPTTSSRSLLLSPKIWITHFITLFSGPEICREALICYQVNYLCFRVAEALTFSRFMNYDSYLLFWMADFLQRQSRGLKEEENPNRKWFKEGYEDGSVNFHPP